MLPIKIYFIYFFYLWKHPQMGTSFMKNLRLIADILGAQTIVKTISVYDTYFTWFQEAVFVAKIQLIMDLDIVLSTFCLIMLPISVLFSNLWKPSNKFKKLISLYLKILSQIKKVIDPIIVCQTTINPRFYTQKK